MPILYGNVLYESESAVTSLMKQVRDTSTVQLVDNYYRRYPTYTTDVAKVLADIIEAKHKVRIKLKCLSTTDFCPIFIFICIYFFVFFLYVWFEEYHNLV